MKKIFLISIFLMMANLTQAGSEGGGGDAVILPNGEVVLADVFLDRNQPQPSNMPRRISLNPKLLLQVKIYTQFMKRQLERAQFGGGELIALFEKLGLRDSGLVFYSVNDVKELNTFCASGGKKAFRLPDGAELTQVACTSGDEVFLVEPIFRKMSIIQQTLLLMHERMTTLKDQFGGKNYGAIAGITSGLGELLNQAYRQQKGEYKKLTLTEQTRIRHFYEGLLELSYRNSDIPVHSMDWEIHVNGGGLKWLGGIIEDSVFLGVTSLAGGDVTLTGKTRVIESLISGRAEILDSEILNSIVGISSWRESGKFFLGNVNISDSTLLLAGGDIQLKDGKIYKSQLSGTMTFVSNSEIISSKLEGNLTFGKNVNLNNAEIIVQNLAVGNDFNMQNGSISYPATQRRVITVGWVDFPLTPFNIVIGDGQSLINSWISPTSLNFYPEGLAVEMPVLKSARIQTSCQGKLRSYLDISLKTNCHFYDDKYGRYGDSVNRSHYFHPPTALDTKWWAVEHNDPGIEIKFDRTLEMKQYGKGNGNWLEVLRDYQIEISFHEVKSKHCKTVFNGIISNCGALKKYEIRFWRNLANQSLLQLITSLAQEKGILTSYNSEYSILTLELPVR